MVCCEVNSKTKSAKDTNTHCTRTHVYITSSNDRAGVVRGGRYGQGGGGGGYNGAGQDRR